MGLIVLVRPVHNKVAFSSTILGCMLSSWGKEGVVAWVPWTESAKVLRLLKDVGEQQSWVTETRVCRQNHYQENMSG